MLQLPPAEGALSVIKKVIGHLHVQMVRWLVARKYHQRREDRRPVMCASSVDSQGIGLQHVLIMVDLVHRSAQNPLQEALDLRRIPAPEGEVGRKAGKGGLSRLKEEHLALQMICEAVGQSALVSRHSEWKTSCVLLWYCSLDSVVLPRWMSAQARAKQGRIPVYVGGSISCKELTAVKQYSLR